MESVLQRSHEIYGNKLEISDKPAQVKPTPKKRRNTPASKEEEVVLAANAIPVLICLVSMYLPIGGFQLIPRDCNDKGRDLCRAGGQSDKSLYDNLF